jgi:hypothetical protein
VPTGVRVSLSGSVLGATIVIVPTMVGMIGAAPSVWSSIVVASTTGSFTRLTLG